MGVVVSLDEGKKPSASVKALMDLTAQDMGRVNELILSKAGSNVELIPEIASHLISSGGKRNKRSGAVDWSDRRVDFGESGCGAGTFLMRRQCNGRSGVQWWKTIALKTGTRLAPANPRKQKSQQALTC